jgi:thymidine kinase
MFTEDSINPQNRVGWIEVITGSMFSGKTEELIRRLKRARIANQKVEIFKPKIDNRYSVSEVISHDENAIPSIPVESSQEIELLATDAEVIGIDEAQFFDSNLPRLCNELANRGKRVIVAGLDMDFLGRPFGPVPVLMAIAEYVTKVHAICVRCGNLAQYTHRKTQQQQRVLIGELDIYEPLCRKCFHNTQQTP